MIECYKDDVEMDTLYDATQRDRIRNIKVRTTVKVSEIIKRVQERRLQSFGHVEKRDEEKITLERNVRSIKVWAKSRRRRPKEEMDK